MAKSITCPHCRQKFDEVNFPIDQPGACPACGRQVSESGVQNRFPGAQVSDRIWRKKAFWQIASTLGVLLLLFIFLMPMLAQSIEADRRNRCINNLKNLGLAMRVHQNIRKTLPLASSEPRTGHPGSAQSPNPAGYSWVVALLPFMEEAKLYDQLSAANSNFNTTPFNSASEPELACQPIERLRCPSDRGEEFVDPSNVEYPRYSTPQGNVAPARSNYVALAASHFTNSQGPGELFEEDGDKQFDGNGAIPFPLSPANMHNGLSPSDITDGTCKTMILAETGEAVYAAWMDGQATWVIGAWQGDSQVPKEGMPWEGYCGWPASDQRSRASVQLDPLTNPSEVYLSATRYGASHDRVWGPSSMHGNGVVNHLFVHGHVVSLVSDEIDRNIYLSLYSRNGLEPLTLDADCGER